MKEWIAVATLLAALGLAGCKDQGRCLQEHSAPTVVPLWIGKTPIILPMTQSVCDRWEFPGGRPTAEKPHG